MSANLPRPPTSFGVINHEEQYSIWPTDRPTPAGWTRMGKVGTDLECLAHIKALPRAARPASRPSLLFDLTESELLTALARYSPDAPMKRVREFLRPPFKVERFPNLAAEVGPAAVPKVLADLWAQVRLGVSPAALARHFEAEMNRYADLWDQEQEAAGFDLAALGVPRLLGGPIKCGPASRVDDGAFRIKVNTTRVWGVVVSYGSVRVDHYKRNANGKYKDEKASRLEVEGTAFAGISGGPVQAYELKKVETNEKKCKATFTYFGLAEIPFVEGCGGVNRNGPLWTCACSGNNPGQNPDLGGEFPGGPGGGLDGGIVDGGF